MNNYIKGLLAFIFFYIFQCNNVQAQSRPFVPVEYQYPPSVLSTAKTYRFKNPKTGAFRYKDITLERAGDDLIVHWKEYDSSPIADSGTEVNHKELDHYMLTNNMAIKAVIGEDSVYQDGTKLGERVQTFYLNLSDEVSLLASMRSSYLKDTSFAWKGTQVPCLVIQSYQVQRLTNSLFPDKPKEVNGVIYYYYGKGIGLLMYRSESTQDRSTWELQDIKEKGNK